MMKISPISIDNVCGAVQVRGSPRFSEAATCDQSLRCPLVTVNLVHDLWPLLRGKHARFCNKILNAGRVRRVAARER